DDLRVAGDDGVEIHLIERLAPVFEPPAGDDLEPFEQGLRFRAPVGFDDADDDIVAVALAGAGLLQHFVGLADAGRGTDKDLEPARLPLFAPRGLEQAPRRRSLVRVAPLIRHHESNSSSPAPSILPQMPRSVTAMLEGPAPRSRIAGRADNAWPRAVPNRPQVYSRSADRWHFRLQTTCERSLAPLRRYFEPSARERHRAPS